MTMLRSSASAATDAAGSTSTASASSEATGWLTVSVSCSPARRIARSASMSPPSRRGPCTTLAKAKLPATAASTATVPTKRRRNGSEDIGLVGLVDNGELLGREQQRLVARRPGIRCEHPGCLDPLVGRKAFGPARKVDGHADRLSVDRAARHDEAGDVEDVLGVIRGRSHEPGDIDGLVGEEFGVGPLAEQHRPVLDRELGGVAA